MMTLQVVLISHLFSIAHATSLWSSSAARPGKVINQAYPVGNGRLGAMPFGSLGVEKINLNVDSLWAGGPYEASNYSGGNPTTAKYQYLPGIRDWIFENGVGNVSQLLGDNNNYGTFRVLGNLSVSILDIANYNSTSYKRSLDLTTGIHTTESTLIISTKETGLNSTVGKITSSIYCSYPDQVCVYHISADAPLPQVTFTLENQLAQPDLNSVTCGSNQVQINGVVQSGPPTGMKYTAIARVINSSLGANDSTEMGICNDDGSFTIPAATSRKDNNKELTIIISAGTDYDQTKGNIASGYSFKGQDPDLRVIEVVMTAASKPESELRRSHVADYKKLMGTFTLDLPDFQDSADVETSELLQKYNGSEFGEGNPYVESLLFKYGRHLLISSSRPNSLPANLQGLWSTDLESSWGGDYHANINLQMNYWGAEETGLGTLTEALWRYIRDTWVPRGEETARLLYGSEGWVVHDEINIFGHTGMKYAAQWANYPAAAAWMMQHIWDRYDYSRNTSWLEREGYPLIKGVALFWLSELQEDRFFNDGSLVVNPCNSPEHGPTTFGCAHDQQLLYQLFTSALRAERLLSKTNQTSSLEQKYKNVLEKLDTGLHFSNFSTIKEWKLPDSFGYDQLNDTHRHLSHLIGWYPGASIASLLGGYTNERIQAAVTTSLESRGIGTGPDANSGWEKVWRAACWARLNNTDRADFELRYAIATNFGPNALSFYSGHSGPFQIDANFGLVGAIVSMLVVDLPFQGQSKTTLVQERTVVLGPAIPKRWAGGTVKGLRLRGGSSVDFEWDENGVVTNATLVGAKNLRLVNKNGVRINHT